MTGCQVVALEDVSVSGHESLNLWSLYVEILWNIVCASAKFSQLKLSRCENNAWLQSQEAMALQCSFCSWFSDAYISPHISILLNCAELGTESFVCHIDCYDCYDDYRHFISCWFNLIHDFQQAKQQQKRFEVSFSSPALTLDSSTLLEWLSSWASSSWGSIIWQDTRKGLIYCSSRMF